MNQLIARNRLSGRAVAVTGTPDTKRFHSVSSAPTTLVPPPACLVELARALKDERLRNDIWLVFFDGEEAFVEWSGLRQPLRQPPPGR